MTDRPGPGQGESICRATRPGPVRNTRLRRPGFGRILNRAHPRRPPMFGPDSLAALALAASVLAPALPARPDGVGETGFAKQSGVAYGEVGADGTFSPVGRLRSIQYVVVKDEK